jgi:hypothetical protein
MHLLGEIAIGVAWAVWGVTALGFLVWVLLEVLVLMSRARYRWEQRQQCNHPTLPVPLTAADVEWLKENMRLRREIKRMQEREGDWRSEA